jgi:hypothetical protein
MDKACAASIPGVFWAGTVFWTGAAVFCAAETTPATRQNPMSKQIHALHFNMPLTCRIETGCKVGIKQPKAAGRKTDFFD